MTPVYSFGQFDGLERWVRDHLTELDPDKNVANVFSIDGRVF